jgi:hypothetical protein
MTYEAHLVLYGAGRQLVVEKKRELTLQRGLKRLMCTVLTYFAKFQQDDLLLALS